MSAESYLAERPQLTDQFDEPPSGDLKWAIIAAASREEAERYVARRGLRPCLFLSKAELLADPLAFRRELRARRVDVLAVHSRSWKRQRSSQVFEAALVLAPVKRRLIVDGECGGEYELDARQLTLELSRAPADVMHGLGMVAREIAAFQEARRKPRRSDGASRYRDHRAVIAIWHGLQVTDVGGAATHIAGILGGFRALGLRIGLVTTEPPPAQLAPIVDDVEIVSPLPRGARLTRDMEELTMNRPVEHAALALARRLGPSLIYQRHRQYLWAGGQVSRATCSPLVLEWNNSEAWVRDNYDRRRVIGRLLDPVVEAMEHYMLQMADLTAAVSAPAADMALARGASPDRVAVIPNGVNVEEIARLAAEGGGPHPGQDPLIGWVGAFCQWHGTEVLVRSLPFLPQAARLLLIGAGDRQGECESIARELGVSDRIELTGALPHAEAVRRLARCDVLASPHVEIPNQRFFGSPTKMFEYMAIGRPIVASRLEQIGEVLTDGVTARLVPPGDERKLARAIEQILSSPDRGAALALAARRHSKQHTWDQRASSILAGLSSMTTASPAPPG